MKKILPVKYPPITTYNVHSSLFAILMAQENQEIIKKWFVHNYIETWAFFAHDEKRMWPESDGIRVNFSFLYSMPNIYLCKDIINRNIINRDMINEKWENFSQCIIEQIDRGYYVNATINLKYVCASRAYNKYNFNHNQFIYGYDNDKKEMYIADFYHTKFEFKKASYSEINKAFNNVDRNKLYDSQINIYFSKYNENFNTNIYISKIILLLDLYIKGEMASVNPCYYGISVYDYIIQLIEHDSLFMPAAYLMYDHKKAMNLRFEYLHDLNIYHIDQEHKMQLMEIEKRAEVLPLILLKYNLNRKQELKDKMIEKYRAIKELEFNVLSEIVENMKKVLL